MPIKVEIVTPVHNRCEETLQCLRSIARSESTGLSLHVIVVDDGSTDGTADAIAKEFPDVEIVKGDGDLWYTAGTNRGISAALLHEPDYILAINNDQVFDEKCIVNLVYLCRKIPAIGCRRAAPKSGNAGHGLSGLAAVGILEGRLSPLVQANRLDGACQALGSRTHCRKLRSIPRGCRQGSRSDGRNTAPAIWRCGIHTANAASGLEAVDRTAGTRLL